MKGLLIKDFKLLQGQKNFFITIIAIAGIMAIFMEDASFIIGYMTFVGSLFTLSTISYDEFDNGNAFLFSLPITRKDYILEKYGFGLIVGGISSDLGNNKRYNFNRGYNIDCLNNLTNTTDNIGSYAPFSI